MVLPVDRLHGPLLAVVLNPDLGVLVVLVIAGMVLGTGGLDALQDCGDRTHFCNLLVAAPRGMVLRTVAYVLL